MSKTWEHTRYYTETRRSVTPYLTNLGAETVEAIAARIKAESEVGLGADAKRWIPEGEWRRW